MEAFKEKYNTGIFINDQDFNISVKIGTLNKGQYRETDISINFDNIINQIKDVVKRKILEEKIHIMDYDKFTTNEIFILNYEDTFINPIPEEMDNIRYQEILNQRGNIIVIDLLIDDKKYHIFIGDTGGDILSKGGLIQMGNNPKVLSRNETLIINPNNLICIRDFDLNMLIIKNPDRASILYELDEHFEMKARLILSETIENYTEIKLTKDNIKDILKNHHCYTMSYINRYKQSFKDVMAENGIKQLQDDEHGEIQKIILTGNQINDYIKGLNKIIIRNAISGEEEETQL